MKEMRACAPRGARGPPRPGGDDTGIGQPMGDMGEKERLMYPRSIIALAVAALVASGASPALAQRCPDMCQVFNGTANQTFRCDMVCTAGVTCKVSDASDYCPAKCGNGMPGVNNGQICEFDSDCTDPSYPFCDYAGDGTIALCGSSGDDVIQGAGTADVLCGNDGDDTITGGGGADWINGGAGDDDIDGGNAADVIEGGDGSDVISGGAGNDNMYGNGRFDFSDDGGNTMHGDNNDDFMAGAGGDDVLTGDNGDDTLFGQGGRDVLKGGDGDDILIGNYGGPTVNDVLGSLYCGGKGDDAITGDGPGHQCIDGGPDQVVTGSESDCVYHNLPDDTDDHDVGTAINCANPTQSSTNGTLLGSTPDCGCMD